MPELSASNRAAPDPVAETKGRTVLFVDDNDAVRITSADVLRSAGFIVEEADSGDAALGLLHMRRFDIAVIEIGACQPGTLDKVDHLVPRPALVLTSSMSLAEQPNEVHRSQNFRFLRKPVRPMALIDSLSDALGTGAS